MTLSRLLCAGAVLLLTAAPAAAKPGVATSTVNLRADPNTASDVLVKIPAGARVEVGDCNDGWCAVTFQGKSGHAIATSLDTTGRAAPPRQAVRRGPPPPGGPAYADDDDEVVQGPAPRGYVRVPGPGAYVEPRPYYAPGPYWGPYWGPRWRYWW
jgi:uncharacterized protein YgiM (DUF1202 family)